VSQGVLPDREQGHRFDGTLQDGHGQGKLPGLTAHLHRLNPVVPDENQNKAKGSQTMVLLIIMWKHGDIKSQQCDFYLSPGTAGVRTEQEQRTPTSMNM
jgi:hypothetical protein